MDQALADADRVLAGYRSLGGDELSDAELVDAVSTHVRLPREEPADSFILHAPLELLARAALLPWVAPSGRTRARLRLVALQQQFDAVSPAAMAMPAPTSVSSDPGAAARALATAMNMADLEVTDAAAAALAQCAPASALAALLGDAVVPMLSAAGHAPIFLYQLPRAAPRAEADGGLLRPLVRELARYPQLRIEWCDDPSRVGGSGGSAVGLADALRSTPALGVPGSTFIYPVMHQVDAAGVAEELLGPTLAGIAPDDAARVLLRFAARAMVLGPHEHMPYGWTHCLTMPQAAVRIAAATAVPQLAVDVAGTYVVGFLAALAGAPIPDSVELPDPGGSFAEALATGREAAAGWVLHRPAHELRAVSAQIATRASVRADAHVVKYVLACLDEAAADPDAARLFLAAAAALLAYWEPIDEPDDPLRGLNADVLV